MRDGWLKTTFRAFASLEKGISYKSSELCDEGEGMPFINLKSIDRGGGYRADGLKWYSGKFKSSQVVEPGDLILCCTDLTKQKAILGYPILVPAIGYSRFCISLDLAKILVDEKMILKSFLFLLLQDRRMREFMQSRSSGTTVMHLKTSEVPDVQVELPPLPEQKRIVDLISSVDCYIESLEKQLETGKSARNSILHELLSTPGPDWIKTTLGEVAEVLPGFAFKSELFNESEGVPLIRIRDLPNKSYTQALYSGIYEDRYVVSKGDFLIGMDGEFHCYEWNGPKALLNQRVCRLQGFKVEIVEPRFIYFTVNKYLDKIEKETGYTTVKHISTKQILGIKIPLPPLPEQKSIVEIVSEFDSFIENVETAIEEAKKLRSGLLSELLSGEHEIPASYDKVMSVA